MQPSQLFTMLGGGGLVGVICTQLFNTYQAHRRDAVANSATQEQLLRSDIWRRIDDLKEEVGRLTTQNLEQGTELRRLGEAETRLTGDVGRLSGENETLKSDLKIERETNVTLLGRITRLEKREVLWRKLVRDCMDVIKTAGLPEIAVPAELASSQDEAENTAIAA